MATALLTGCLFLRPAATPADGTTVILSEQVTRAFDSIAAKSVRENAEQAACVERFTITENSGGRIFTLDRIGASPLKWESTDSTIAITGPYTHLCYSGQPVLHTHPVPYYRASQLDWYTAWEGDRAPFAVLLVAAENKSWKVLLYAVRP